MDRIHSSPVRVPSANYKGISKAPLSLPHSQRTETTMSQFHLLLTLSLLLSSSLAFQSDELFIDDEEFGLEGGLPDLAHIRSSQPPPNSPPPTTTTTRKRYSDSDPDSKIQFSLELAFGDFDFFPAGTFTARCHHGGPSLIRIPRSSSHSNSPSETSTRSEEHTSELQSP